MTTFFMTNRGSINAAFVRSTYSRQEIRNGKKIWVKFCEDTDGEEHELYGKHSDEEASARFVSAVQPVFVLQMFWNDAEESEICFDRVQVVAWKIDPDGGCPYPVCVGIDQYEIDQVYIECGDHYRDTLGQTWNDVEACKADFRKREERRKTYEQERLLKEKNAAGEKTN